MGAAKTTSAVAVIALFDVIRDHGMSVQTLEKQTGISRKKMDDPDARITMTQFLNLWQIAEKVSNNPAIGLTLRQHYQTQTKHFVVLMAMNCNNFLEALQAWARYDMIICNNGRIDLIKEKDLYGITYTNVSPRHENRWIPEHHASLAIEYARQITQREFNPVRVCFRHKDPGYAHVYKDIFKCPVLFDQEANQIWVKEKELHQPIPGSDAYLRAVLEKHADTSIEKLSRELTFQNKVQEFMVRHLHQGTVSIQAASDAMNMDRSTLHRRLKKENTSFRLLLTETRKELAQKYLGQGLSITQTAYLLGFSDPSTFQRAFKRWTGIAPGQYKEEFQGTSKYPHQ